MQERRDLGVKYPDLLTPKILTGSDGPKIPDAPEDVRYDKEHAGLAIAA